MIKTMFIKKQRAVYRFTTYCLGKEKGKNYMEGKIRSKEVLSILIAFLLVFTAFPLTAFAKQVDFATQKILQ